MISHIRLKMFGMVHVSETVEGFWRGCQSRQTMKVNAMDDEKKLIKDRNCRLCQFVIECEGKPEGVELCLNFRERKLKENGGKKDVHTENN